MHYVIGDIHNEAGKLESILSQMNLRTEDELILLGDIFDRGFDAADPVKVYFTISGVRACVKWVMGNHDFWLATYIKRYFETPVKRRKKLPDYPYNSFEMLNERLTEADMMNLAGEILDKPLLIQEISGNHKYLFSHARTSHPLKQKQHRDYYLMGGLDLGQFFIEGVEGYISICGHTPTSSVSRYDGKYLDDTNSVWINAKQNVILLDCGAGFRSGTLAGMCLETGERFYAE